ncbi:metallophosphoesterase family protein [Bosea sp. RAC05]|jgi:DNA repair exonuclease SbcCD nuclease subunit|uniref:metallophosphoesterase family protein n=1 Tax=Bosea sp. RAC05 TaxID=1842539 RepID=UPI00083E35DD|nr:DNA repair exonuclease [Bosea sp. RAC05]AOG06088.1 calcineurin-like phosphoesterase family protein [Bosea sp. RAC05]
MFRFLHTSDLHIGKRFGTMPDELRGRLREARHTVLDRLAAQARAGGAQTVLLAGDSFDTETPSPAMLRQALAAMAGHAPLRWIILPGNHDSLLADELWAATRAALPGNVVLATEAAPLALAPDVVILPAPCTTRRPGRDLTDWMDSAPTPEGALRIGLAHGAIQSFSEDGGGLDIIAPDRAIRAGLDYLALGDWHGQMPIGPRSWYSGSPEPDRFKHDEPGRALLVSLAGPGAVPDVAPVETGSFDWRSLPLDLLSGDDGASALTERLPAGPVRRQTLLRVVAAGRLRPQARAGLEAAIAAVAPEFAFLQLDAEALATDCESDDLDAIDRAGALRQAADALLTESLDEARSAAERQAARDALARLFSYCAAMPS